MFAEKDNMARQAGSRKIVGTIDDICFYKMEGGYYARSRSSLDRKRFFKDPAFARSRRSSSELGKASTIASGLYKLFKKEKKSREAFRKLTGEVKLKIGKGWTEEGIRAWFFVAYAVKLISVNRKPVSSMTRKKIIKPGVWKKSVFAVVPPSRTRCRRNKKKKSIRERGHLRI